jgi:hypothetical protein
MKRTFAFAALAFALLISSARADVVYDTYNGASAFEAPAPFGQRILDFIVMDQVGAGELDGLRLGFTVANAPTDVMIFVEFWANVTPGAADPLAGATSLGTQGINFGNITGAGGFGGGIASGLAANANDIILPGDGAIIGVEFRFRLDGSNYNPDLSGRLVTASAPVGSTTPTYYIDTGLDGFDAGDLVTKPAGKALRLEISTISVIPEPASAGCLALLMIGGVGLIRRRS